MYPIHYFAHTIWKWCSHCLYLGMKKKDKKGYIVYTLKICFNPETDDIEYICEGVNEDFNFTPIVPFDLDIDITSKLNTEDMEAILELYEVGEA